MVQSFCQLLFVQNCSKPMQEPLYLLGESSSFYKSCNQRMQNMTSISISVFTAKIQRLDLFNKSSYSSQEFSFSVAQGGMFVKEAAQRKNKLFPCTLRGLKPRTYSMMAMSTRIQCAPKNADYFTSMSTRAVFHNVNSHTVSGKHLVAKIRPSISYCF